MKKMWVVLGVLMLVSVLAGCSGAVEETEDPYADFDYASIISVTGEVVPDVWTELSVQNGGRVLEVLVEPGDEVRVGDVLVRLEATDAELMVREAQAALDMAQAERDCLQAGARTQEIAAAQAQVDAAAAALAQAQAAYQQVESGSVEAEIAAAEAALASAQLERQAAQSNYDQIQNANIHGWMEEQAVLALQAADEALAAAQAQLDAVQSGSQSQLDSAQAAVWAAAAQRDAAQAQLDQLQAGATEAELAAADAAVAQAQAALDAAQVALDRTEIEAILSGVVGLVHVQIGEQVMPGQPVVTIGDLSTLQVETTDLDEIDVAQVNQGQPVDVTFDALSEQVFTGHVTLIYPMSQPGSGGVSYTAIIEVDELDPAIRWGMTAFVDIELEE